LHNADADSKLPRYLHQAKALGAPLANRTLDLSRHLGSAYPFPLRSRSREPGLYALHDHPALEFREYTAHREHCLAGWCGAVDRLLMQVKADSKLTKLGHEADNVVQAPSEAVYGPRHDDISLASGTVPVQPVEAGARLPTL